MSWIASKPIQRPVSGSLFRLGGAIREVEMNNSRRTPVARTRLFLETFVLLAVLSSLVIAGAGVQSEALDAERKAAVVRRVGELLSLNYVFPDKGKEMEAVIARKHAEGQYDKVSTPREFAGMLTADLRSVTGDKHLRVEYNPETVRRIRARNAMSAEEREKERRRALEVERRRNYGFAELEILDGNIGYLELTGFSGNENAGDTAAAAMNFLANADAVIIDLRGNGGGSPYTIQFISSYFLEKRTHLNSFQWRGQDEIQEFWTLPSVPGKRLYDKDLYILTSPRTFSAAEEFTYNLKNLKRATIVGETTGGGAHPGGSRIVDDGFFVWIPSGRAINPITKTNWEGTGIEPHIAVPQEKALDKAYADALGKQLDKATDDDRKFSLKWALDWLKAMNEPADVDRELLTKYVGHYRGGAITLEGGTLYTTLGGRKFKMIPVSSTYFVLEGFDTARVEFVPGKSGGDFAITVHFRDGSTETHSKLDRSSGARSRMF